MTKAWLWLLPLALGAGFNPPPAPAQPAPAQETQNLTLAALKNGTYTLPDQGTFTLNNGSFSQGSLNLRLIPPIALGDVTQDGLAEAAVILALETGGSGTFIYLALAAPQGGQLQNLDTYFLGDRVRVQSLSIQDNQVRVTFLKHRPTDPQCCPGELAVQAYQFTASGELAPITLDTQTRQQIQIQDLPTPAVAEDDDFPDAPPLGEFQIKL
ncbi:MAG: hypothetical protein VKN60_11355 [Cyanobacteriota bacterium]|nr:hypothetical protein [Cyanobacteriota bacterium]